MDTTSYVALSRQMALARRMEVLAHNLANATTPGFKAERLRFEVVPVRAGKPGYVAFVQDVGRLPDFADGPLSPTGNPMDFALSGPGFLTLGTPEGPVYARGGRFRMNEDGALVGPAGAVLLDETGAPVAVPAGSRHIHVAEDGTLSSENGVFGRLQVVSFADASRLERVGDGLFRSSQAPNPAPGTRIVQGAIEGSNVEAVAEITSLVETTRAFEAVQRMIEAVHEVERRQIHQAVGDRA